MTEEEAASSGEDLLDGGLPVSERQQQFSLAHVHMIASAAGCSIKRHDTDYDGVDITIASSTEYETYLCPEIELQVKCTSQRRLLRDDHLAWQMSRTPFLKLTNRKRFTPAFLGVLLIPEQDAPLLNITEEHLLTASCMYWQAASQLGEIAEGSATKTVHLPRSNLFDVDALKGIMQAVGEGGTW